MYYEEKLIDGILHWRDTPDGEWQVIPPADEMARRAAAANIAFGAVDGLLKRSIPTDDTIFRATVVALELAHKEER